MIDLHTHVLPGIDDGPAAVEGSVELARAALAQGTTTLVATPHVTWDLPGNDAGRIAAGVAALAAELGRANVDVALATGGEVALTRAHELPDEELRALSLGGRGWLLVECPLSTAAPGFEASLHALAARGHRLVLAHPERCPALHRDLGLMRRLVADGMVSSITAGSLRGSFGSTVKRFALTLLEEDLVHNLTSDAHDAVRRPPGIADALAAAETELSGIGERAEWLTLSVPRAILDGGPIPDAPAPPPVPRRRRGLFRRAARQR